MQPAQGGKAFINGLLCPSTKALAEAERLVNAVGLFSLPFDSVFNLLPCIPPWEEAGAGDLCMRRFPGLVLDLFPGWHCWPRKYSQIPDLHFTPISKGWAVSTAAISP